MSTFTPGPADEPAWAARLAHSRIPAVTVFALYCATTIRPWRDLLVAQPEPIWVTLADFSVFVALMGWYLLAEVCWHKHPMALCSRCMTDTPADGEAEAQRKMRRLRLHHWEPTRAETWRFRVLVGAGIATVLFAPSWWKLIGALVLAGYWAYVVYEARAARTHVRLVQWCPWCRRRWDDDDQPAPEPVPEPDPGAPVEVRS